MKFINLTKENAEHIDCSDEPFCSIYVSEYSAVPWKEHRRISLTLTHNSVWRIILPSQPIPMSVKHPGINDSYLTIGLGGL